MSSTIFVTIDQINSAIEAEGLSRRWKGGRCEVYNSSGKRHLGAIYPLRAGGYGRSLSGLLGDRLAERLAALSVEPAPAAADTDTDLAQVARDARAGVAASRGHSEQDVLDAVRMGHLSESDAMNQDD